MNLKLTNFSTIIIVNKNQEQTQAIRIKTKHLKRVKHYAVSIVCLVLTLLGAIIYLNSKNSRHEEENQQLLTQITQLKNKIPVVVKTPASLKAANISPATTY